MYVHSMFEKKNIPSFSGENLKLFIFNDYLNIFFSVQQ